MCGIAGIYQLDGKPVSASILQDMCDVIKHRGPDGEGQYLDGPVGLGHRRLRIIDLSEAGKQPMSNEDGTVWITFNGEIYNFLELRADLLRKGHQFSSKTDTEVMIHLYEEQGPAFLGYLRGMFSLALWDSKKQQLLLARDRLGIKPLVYALDGQKLIFASEIKSLLRYPDVDRTLDYEAIGDYFTYAYIPDPKTIYRSVRKLPPAHYMTVDSQGVHIVRYWTLQPAYDDARSKTSYMDELVELIKESVRLHLISDVPIGAFLSGGVDSSTVVAMMKAVGQLTKTFSIGYEEEDFSELKYARQVAEHLGTDHCEIIVRPDDLRQIIKKLVWQFDEPFADSSAIPTYYVCSAAREHVTVCLSGDGGDENFAGYNRHLMAGRYQDRDVLSSLRNVLKSAVKFAYAAAPKGTAINTQLAPLTFDPLDYYGNRVSIYSQTMAGAPLKKLLSDDLFDCVSQSESYALLRHHYKDARTSNFLTGVRYVDTMTYLPGDNLTKVDKTSMLKALEVRVPLLDHHIVEFAATIPPRYLVEGDEGKVILKEAMEPYLPHNILYRQKMGFMLLMQTWAGGQLEDYFEEMILDGHLGKRGYLNAEFVQSLFEQHKSGKADWNGQLWSAVSFEEWCQQNLD